MAAHASLFTRPPAAAGTLLIKQLQVTPRPSFLDYLRGARRGLGPGGCAGGGWGRVSCEAHSRAGSAVQLTPARSGARTPPALHPRAGGLGLNFLVAIDYTASNRDPRDPSSLHFLGTPTTIYEVRWRSVR